MDTIIGIAWTMLGALFLGTFALPSKYVKNYAWENTWGAFFLFAMLIVPVGVAMLAVNGLWDTYAGVSWPIILGVMGLSFLWGCGFCCWGYGLSMVGLSLGYSLTMGTMALVGSMVPFFLGSADMIATTGGMIVIGGILVCILGVAVNGYAGMQREKSQPGEEAGGEAKKKTPMAVGLLVCVLAGVLSSGLNIAFHVGNNVGKIAEISEGLGNPAWVAGLSTWTLVFLGGMISSVGFSLLMLTKNKTWKGFGNVGTGRNLVFAFLMAVGHFACIFFYGIGGWTLGALGTSVGFSIFQSGSLLIGNGLGFFTGEWKGASAGSKGWLFAGLAVLILGIIIVSIGNAVSS
ncbi:MAG TPA: L-rhamnose/proton symporter RhaT [Phycisphaerae bacterium]|nr:L-rhamnose/proton symporter RhaT [Phycisphaerae bacterium]